LVWNGFVEGATGATGAATNGFVEGVAERLKTFYLMKSFKNS